MKYEYNIKVIGEVADDNGNRLTLRFIERPERGWIKLPGLTEPTYYYFHSLVWDSNDGSFWKRKATITPANLEIDGRRRWISEIHSLNDRAQFCET